ncbi:translation factor [Testicularia cyperi]|uniref:Threonylcarbamoyl-AMP synthase n=1 Tax=Testicularia cyperi TaxID=1882483 RepID=A0A317XWD5_9BASI|nr:translation factor [Testicularia cyperi]
MASVSGTGHGQSKQDIELLGYPDRTFYTEILPCDTSSPITFAEAGPSRHGEGREPFTRATPEIQSLLTRNSLDTAAEHLQKGQLVSFPSETVYGLGANALSQSASAKIYAAKKRPADNPLIVHVSDLEMLDTLLPSSYEMSEAYRLLVQRFWPGAMTLLFPVDRDSPKVPGVVTCGHPSVAIRMPSHPIARALIATSRLPMAGPSANASGRPSPTTAQHVMRDLGGHLDITESASAAATADGARGRLRYILDGGPCQVGLESTVIDGITAPNELRILRPGGVSPEQIAQALREEGLSDRIQLRVYGKDMERSNEQESNPTTPGMKYRHYSPTARVVMLLPSKLFAKALQTNGDSSAGKVVESLTRNTSASRTHFSEQHAPRDAQRSFASLVRGQLASQREKRPTATLRVGVMVSSDSELCSWIKSSSSAIAGSMSGPTPSAQADGGIHPLLTQPLWLDGLDNVEIHPFDLGPANRADLYAQRMFDGLRTLDEGPLRAAADRCDLIFVEALEDDGVGLAVMNRLKKASSETVVVDC